MRRSILLVLLLSGCAASDAVLSSRPADGYPALRFQETLRLNGPLGGWLEAPAGTVLVGDRQRPNGDQLYCGQMLNSDAYIQQPIFTCVSYSEGKIVARPDRGGGAQTTTAVPGGAVQAFRFR